MEEIYKNRKYCFTITEGPERYVEEWVTNKTTDTIIDIAMFKIAPQVFFTRYNDTLYEWCGTTVILAESFAKMSNTR